MLVNDIQRRIDCTPKSDGVPHGTEPIGGRIPVDFNGSICCNASLKLYSGIGLVGNGTGTHLYANSGFAPIYLVSRNTNRFCSRVSIEHLSIDGGGACCVASEDLDTIESLTLRDLILAGDDTHVSIEGQRAYSVVLDRVEANRVRFGGLCIDGCLVSIANSKFMRQDNLDGVNPIIRFAGQSQQVTLSNTWIEGHGILLDVHGAPSNPAEVNINGCWIEPHGNVGTVPCMKIANAVVTMDRLPQFSVSRPVIITDSLINITHPTASTAGLQLIRCSGKIGGVDIRSVA